ncbi:MAG: hypothetical protein H7259_11190, partial [Cytophagales bacterium]|nr:hypothetical protein [Cytophaga sp.]
MLLYSQEKPVPKSIFSLFHLKNGCPLKKSSDKASERIVLDDGGMAMLDDDPEQINTDSAFQANMMEYQANLSKEFSLNRNADTITALFSNKNYLYKENGLYGIKNASNQIIVSARYERIMHVDSAGFSAYTEGYCKYFTADGNKVIDRSYYFIKKSGPNVFNVQTAKGFGVVSNKGEVVVKPVYYKIDTIHSFGSLYYRVYTNEKDSYFLNETGKDTLWLHVAYYSKPKPFCKDVWIESDKLYNLKIKKQLI